MKTTRSKTKEKTVVCALCGKRVLRSNAMRWVGYQHEAKEAWHCKPCVSGKKRAAKYNITFESICR